MRVPLERKKRGGESGSLRACVVAISWPAYTTHGPHARARPTPRWGPAAPLRRSGDFSGRFTVSVARNDSASVRRRDRRLARLAKVALKFTPPTAEDSPRRSLSLATPLLHFLRRRFRRHYARYYGRSRLRSARARGSKRVTSA